MRVHVVSRASAEKFLEPEDSQRRDNVPGVTVKGHGAGASESHADKEGAAIPWIAPTADQISEAAAARDDWNAAQSIPTATTK
jgi:hypothetical protein